MKFKNIMLQTEFVWKGWKFIKITEPITVWNPYHTYYDKNAFSDKNATCLTGPWKGTLRKFDTKSHDDTFTQIKF